MFKYNVIDESDVRRVYDDFQINGVRTFDQIISSGNYADRSAIHEYMYGINRALKENERFIPKGVRPSQRHLDVRHKEFTSNIDKHVDDFRILGAYNKKASGDLMNCTKKELSSLFVEYRRTHNIKAGPYYASNILGELDRLKKETFDAFGSLGETANLGIDNIQTIITNYQKKHLDISVTGYFDPATKKHVRTQQKLLIERLELIGVPTDHGKDLNTILKSFQRDHQLDKTCGLNEQTLAKIAEIENQTQQKITRVIHNVGGNNLQQNVKLYQRIRNLPQEKATVNKAFLKQLDADQGVLFVNVNGSYRSFDRNPISLVDGEASTIRLNKTQNIFVKIEPDMANTIAHIEKQFSRKYLKSEIVIYPFTDNSKTLEVLNTQYRKGYIKPKERSTKKIERIFKKHEKRTMFTVGHVENGAYVSGEFRVPLDELNKLAQKYEVNIYHLGCNTATIDNAVGTTELINTFKTMNELIPLIKKHNTFGDLIGEFSTQKIGVAGENEIIGLVIDSETFKQQNYARFRAYRTGGVAVGIIIGGGFIIYELTEE